MKLKFENLTKEFGDFTAVDQIYQSNKENY